MAATHGRSFWILDDVSPLRGLAERPQRRRACSPPRTTIRTKLHFGAPAPTCAAASPIGPAFGIDGST